jgi:hypothetical protein
LLCPNLLRRFDLAAKCRAASKQRALKPNSA